MLDLSRATRDDRMHQYCWAHLPRDLHEVVTAHPRAARVTGWAAVIQMTLHRVSACAVTNPMVVGQVTVDQKSNEITAMPALLRRFFRFASG